MAMQRGSIKVDDEIVGYFQYNRTVGLAQTRIYLTEKEVSLNWRTIDHEREYTCSSDPIVAELNSGNEIAVGRVWQSKICLNCLAIVGNIDPTNNIDAFLSQYYSDSKIDELKREWGWI